MLGLQGIGTGADAVAGLRQHVAAGRGRGMRIGEAAHAGQRAEIVIEGAVLLHQDDDVAHVPDRAAAAIGLDRQRALDGVREVLEMGRTRFDFHDGINTACDRRILRPSAHRATMRRARRD